MTSTVDARAHKEAVSVKIRPNERWMGGSTVTLLAFKILNLPQDSAAYSECTRDELVDRCLSSAERVRVHIFM